MKVAILDDYQDAVRGLDAFARLDGFEVDVLTGPEASVDALAARLAGVAAIVPIRERTRIDAALLDRLPDLRLVSQTGKVGHHLDVAACTARGVAVAEGSGSPVAPAELTFALILAASRHVVPYAERLQHGDWQSSGAFGQRVAGFARAFGMRVLVWGSAGSRERAVADGCAAAGGKAQLFAEADVLTLHLRLAEATAGCVTLADLRSMRPDALFVNTSRAELVEPGALARALTSGRPGFAAVDVFEDEPARPGDEPLLALPNVLATPHVGFVERDGYELYFGTAFENVVEDRDGSPLFTPLLFVVFGCSSNAAGFRNDSSPLL